MKPSLRSGSVNRITPPIEEEEGNLLVIHRPWAKVSEQHSIATQARRSGRIEIAMRRRSSADESRAGGFRRQPDDSALPVVAMSELGRRRVLGHVPGVHDGEVAVVGAAAGVDLAWAAVTIGGGTARGVQTGAED